MGVSLFAGAWHEPFIFPSPAESDRGALLLHGFTGTAAEMRPLGAALAESGLTVHCPLLPGSGIHFDQLARTKYTDWLDAARSAWSEVRRQYRHTVLVGFSMGGAVAIDCAADLPPDRLILMAPFWQTADRRSGALNFLKFVKPELRPFEHASFDDPAIRDAFSSIDPNFDFDDPAVQDRLRRDYVIPATAILELRKVGENGKKRIADIRCETLILQGTKDDTVLPGDTAELISHLTAPHELVEIDGDHQLVRENRPAWPHVRSLVVDFAARESV